jgi:hypothetical protein
LAVQQNSENQDAAPKHAMAELWVEYLIYILYFSKSARDKLAFLPDDSSIIQAS